MLDCWLREMHSPEKMQWTTTRKPTGFQSALLIQMITENGHSLLQQVTSEYQHIFGEYEPTRAQDAIVDGSYAKT